MLKELKDLNKKYLLLSILFIIFVVLNYNIMNAKDSYVYKHIRLDTNEIFYIGIGSKDSRDIKNGTYTRAFQKTLRNIFWNRIVKKTNYKVKIIKDNLTIKQAKKEEIRLVKLYGKRVNGGTLCNITDGGEGILGYKHTEKTKDIFRKRVLQYDLCGNFIKEWKGIKIAESYYNINHGDINSTCVKRQLSAGGYMWRYKKGNNIPIKIQKYKNPNATSVIQLTMKGKFIKEWISISEVNKKLGLSIAHISNVCRKVPKRHSVGGFKWKFKNGGRYA